MPDALRLPTRRHFDTSARKEAWYHHLQVGQIRQPRQVDNRRQLIPEEVSGMGAVQPKKRGETGKRQS